MRWPRITNPSIDPSMQPTAHNQAGGRIATTSMDQPSWHFFFLLVVGRNQHPSWHPFNMALDLHERPLHGNPETVFRRWLGMISLESPFDTATAPTHRRHPVRDINQSVEKHIFKEGADQPKVNINRATNSEQTERRSGFQQCVLGSVLSNTTLSRHNQGSQTQRLLGNQSLTIY
jgi:hypothetical protein